MCKVGLILTGDAEFLALRKLLARYFPQASFQNVGARKHNAFTTYTLPRLREPARDRDPGTLEKLVAELASAIDPGRSGDAQRFDLVLVVEDLELANRTQPEVVTRHFSEALAEHLEGAWQSLPRRQQAAERLREKGSFHLFAPMLESCFYGDGQALATSGCIPGRPLRFDATARDAEDFLVDDPAYTAVPPPPSGTKDWRRNPKERAFHPKRYLEYLADPNLDGRTRYLETRNGADALAALDLEPVLGQPAHMRFLRSLLLDLAERTPPAPALEPLLRGDFAPETWTPYKQRRDQPFVLRNL